MAVNVIYVIAQGLPDDDVLAPETKTHREIGESSSLLGSFGSVRSFPHDDWCFDDDACGICGACACVLSLIFLDNRDPSREPQCVVASLRRCCCVVASLRRCVVAFIE